MELFKNAIGHSFKWKKIMKISCLQFLLSILLVGVTYANEGSAQINLDKPISLQAINENIGQILTKIEKITSIKFVYSSDILDLNRKVTISLEKRPLKEVLNQVLHKNSIDYKVINDRLVLSPYVSSALANLSKALTYSGQGSKLNLAFDVHGRVTNEDGEPLEGVSVQLKGTNIGTSSDSRGEYSLSVTDGNAVLVFSFVGYSPREVNIRNRSVININLSQSSTDLSEVVIVGYGSQKKSDVTSSIATVTSKELEDIPVASFTEALTGKMAGVRIQQTSAAPGGGISIIIRGISSITAGNTPLYVIDGVPIDNTIANGSAQNAGDADPLVDPLSSLNVEDIQSIDVLKDASATAIYGSRGSNGVVIITTKMGQSGKMKLNVNSSASIQHVAHKLPLMNNIQRAAVNRDAVNSQWFEQGGNIDDPNSVRPENRWIAEEYLHPEELYETVDWQDIMFRKAAPFQNYQISGSGGTDKMNYYISGNYINQDGLIVNSNYKRYGIRANLDAQVSDRVKLGFRVAPSFSTSNFDRTEGIPYLGSTISVITTNEAPQTPFNPDGSYRTIDTLHFFDGSERYSTSINPLQNSKELQNQFDHFRTLGNLFVTIDILGNLSFKSSISADVNIFDKNVFSPSTVSQSGTVPPVIPRGSTFNSRNISWVNENILSYNNTFNEVHNLDLLAGLSEQKANLINSGMESRNFPNDRVPTLNAATSIRSWSSTKTIWSMVSYFGRASYNFNQKYFATATIRRDGSSRFGLNTRWGTFPSGSVGWRITQEPFMQNVSFINELKIRASYGLTGNNQIGNYASYGLLGQTGYILGTEDGELVSGFYQSSISNSDLGWEKAREFDIGIDWGILSNRVFLTADYYRRTSTDLLLNVPLSPTTGFDDAIRNIGKMRNQGFELGIESHNIANRNFSWNSNFNISFNRNKVLELGVDNAPIFGINPAVENNIIMTVTQIGEPVGSFYGYVFKGIYQNQNDLDHNPTFSNTLMGDLMYEDFNNDGKLDENDRTIIGNNYPKYTFGFSNRITYKGFDLTLLIQGVQGIHVLNMMNRTTSYRRIAAQFIAPWVSPDQPGDGKTPTLSSRGNNREVSSWYMEDASYVRFKEATLGYRFSVSKYSTRVYVSARNLFTITGYKGYNPEVNSARNDNTSLTPGVDIGTYPVARVFTLGVNLDL